MSQSYFDAHISYSCAGQPEAPEVKDSAQPVENSLPEETDEVIPTADIDDTDYCSVFTNEDKDIEEESCENMFCNIDGAMLGMGEVWIAEQLDENFQSKGLKVIAINA